MGEAKRNRGVPKPPVVYHHTSTLRTNLIWMNGKIEVEGRCASAFHPQLGEVRTNASLRRGMQDFPPVAWFTSRIAVPKCLQNITLAFADKDSGATTMGPTLSGKLVHGLMLQRIALGFPTSDIPVVPWPNHPGYQTAEGRDLNESARAMGDNPDDWWVSEEAVDVLKASEVWGSRSVFTPRLERRDVYLQDIRRMVTLCRSTPGGAYIPPSWLSPDQARAFARRLNLPIASLR